MRPVRPFPLQGSTPLIKEAGDPRRRRPDVKRLWWMVPVLIGAVFLAVGCSQEKPAKAANPGGEPMIRITTAPVVARDVQRTVEAVGTLAPDEEVTVTGEVSGVVEAYMADLGDRVKKGQILLRLDQREFRLKLERAEATLQAAQKALERAKAVALAASANVERAEAVLEDARVNLKRFEGLLAEGAVSERERDQARTQFDVAQASLRSAQAQYDSDLQAVKNAEAAVEEARAALSLQKKALADTVIRSPIAGVVKGRFVSVGEFIVGGGIQATKLFAVVRDHPLKLKAQVPERFAGEVKVGQGVQVEVEAYPGRTFQGRVTRVGPAVEEETRTFPIEAEVPNQRGLLKPGSFAKAKILIRREQEVPFIPEQALYYFVGITKVFVVTNGTVQERQVKTGLRENGMVEIVEGVKVGEWVATSSLAQLFDGARVQMVEGGRPEKPKGSGKPAEKGR